jgi:hypothetical protein
MSWAPFRGLGRRGGGHLLTVPLLLASSASSPGWGGALASPLTLMSRARGLGTGAHVMAFHGRGWARPHALIPRARRPLPLR